MKRPSSKTTFRMVHHGQAIPLGGQAPAAARVLGGDLADIFGLDMAPVEGKRTGVEKVAAVKKAASVKKKAVVKKKSGAAARNKRAG